MAYEFIFMLRLLFHVGSHQNFSLLELYISGISIFLRLFNYYQLRYLFHPNRDYYDRQERNDSLKDPQILNCEKMVSEIRIFSSLIIIMHSFLPTIYSYTFPV